jgi:hypothetical protein
MNITVALTIHTRAPLDLGTIFYSTKIRKEKYVICRSLELLIPTQLPANIRGNFYLSQRWTAKEERELAIVAVSADRRIGVHGANFNDSKNVVFLTHLCTEFFFS